MFAPVGDAAGACVFVVSCVCPLCIFAMQAANDRQACFRAGCDPSETEQLHSLYSYVHVYMYVGHNTWHAPPPGVRVYLVTWSTSSN